MKKLLAIILVICLAFTLTACGSLNSDDDDIRGEQIGNNNASNYSTDSASNDETENKDFEMGKTNGLVYENKFIGIGCKLNSDWTFYTDEEIRELNNFSFDLAGDEIKEIASNAQIVYDMLASSSDSLSNININLEKIPNVQLATLDIAKNFELIFPTIENGLKNMGCTSVEYTIGSVKIGGKNFTTMFLDSKAENVEIHQALINIKCNGYLASITI